jgi:hypothetical protein
MENKIEVGINIPSHNSDKLKAHDPPVRTITLNPGMYNVPAGFVAQRSVTVDQFRKDVKAKASQILEGNKAVIDDIQQKYKDSDGPAWKSLKTAMAKDQELGRAEYEAHEKLGLQEHYYEMAHYHPYDAANNQNITQRKAELDDAKNNYENIKSARRLLRGSYPEIVAVDVYNQDVKGLFSKRIGIQASNEEIGPAMASGFEKIKDDIDKSIDKINNDDVPLETLSYVLDEVRKDPKYSDRQDEINGWIEGEQSKDKWIKIGTAGIAAVAGLGSTLFGGLPAFVLAGIGAGAGAGGAIYNLERSGDLFDVSQSQRVGNQLSDASYEEAKSDLVMSGVDLVLSGLDAVAVVKSWKGLSKIPDASKLVEKGEEAAHLSQVEKPVAKSVEELKYPEIEAKNANKAESVANKPENEYDAIRDVDGPKTTTRLDSRHAEVSQGIAKRIGKSSPAQASGDIDQLFKQAKVADVELKKLTDDIARSTNGKAVYPPGLKTKARAIEKINADYGGDASKLLDISRSSISFDSADDLYKALDKIDKKAEIVRIKDRFVKPAPGGYRDILVNIKQPNGHITELQLHSKQILDVKGGTGHKLYEQIREINGKAILENRPLSASELRLQNSLIKESEALYDNAFKGFLGK